MRNIVASFFSILLLTLPSYAQEQYECCIYCDSDPIYHISPKHYPYFSITDMPKKENLVALYSIKAVLTQYASLLDNLSKEAILDERDPQRLTRYFQQARIKTINILVKLLLDTSYPEKESEKERNFYFHKNPEGLTVYNYYGLHLILKDRTTETLNKTLKQLDRLINLSTNYYTSSANDATPTELEELAITNTNNTATILLAPDSEYEKLIANKQSLYVFAMNIAHQKAKDDILK